MITKISEDRKYVIVSNSHKAIIRNVLLFWGILTADDAARSYAGYTCCFDKCEKYTKEELENFHKGCEKELPFFEELEKKSDFFKKSDVLISVDDLKKELHYQKFLVMAR